MESFAKRKPRRKRLKKIPFKKWIGILGRNKTDKLMQEIR